MAAGSRPVEPGVSRLLYGELTYQRYFQPSGQAAVGQHEGNLADH